MNSNALIILCVETNHIARTDFLYIKKIIERFFNLGLNKLIPVYLAGKHNFNNPRIKKEIAKLKKEFALTSDGPSYVVMCLDKDKNMSSPQDFDFVDEVISYCAEAEYLLAWFVSNIEDVMWKKIVPNQEKKRMAERFVATRQIENVEEVRLSASHNVNARHKSNILTVLRTIPNIQ